jgi:hypothetical protein
MLMYLLKALFICSQIVPASSIPDGWMGLDIGPDSIKTFNEALDKSQTVIWNGPMGVFEFDKFAAGTEVWRIWIFLQVLIINHSPPFFVFFFLKIA